MLVEPEGSTCSHPNVPHKCCRWSLPPNRRSVLMYTAQGLLTPSTQPRVCCSTQLIVSVWWSSLPLQFYSCLWGERQEDFCTCCRANWSFWMFMINRVKEPNQAWGALRLRVDFKSSSIIYRPFPCKFFDPVSSLSACLSEFIKISFAFHCRSTFVCWHLTHFHRWLNLFDAEALFGFGYILAYFKNFDQPEWQ